MEPFAIKTFTVVFAAYTLGVAVLAGGEADEVVEAAREAREQIDPRDLWMAFGPAMVAGFAMQWASGKGKSAGQQVGEVLCSGVAGVAVVAAVEAWLSQWQLVGVSIAAGAGGWPLLAKLGEATCTRAPRVADAMFGGRHGSQ